MEVIFSGTVDQPEFLRVQNGFRVDKLKYEMKPYLKLDQPLNPVVHGQQNKEKNKSA